MYCRPGNSLCGQHATSLEISEASWLGPFCSPPHGRRHFVAVNWGMLRNFLISHRSELVRICREKAASTFAPADVPDVLDHGVPLFLQQLIDTLADRPSTPADDVNSDVRTLFPAEIGRTAALHGAELLRRGFTVDQVVHNYGDVCQAITETAIKLDRAIVPNDFRILNGCLDSAIAGAVTAFAQGHQEASDDRDTKKHERLSVLRHEYQRLVDIAIQAFTAMKSGNLGLGGATGGLLMHALTELQLLSEQPAVEENDAEAADSLRRASKLNQAL